MAQGLLRFITAGSVDDGKSTLIGRLLYDSKTIFEDQLESIEQASNQRGTDGADLSLPNSAKCCISAQFEIIQRYMAIFYSTEGEMA